MSKELDPSLFGEGAWANPRAVDKPARAYETAEHTKDLEKKFIELRSAYREMREAMVRWTAHLEEMQQSWGLKFERLTQQVSRLEDVQKKVAGDVTQKVSQLHMKVGERGTYDRKVQDMVDRHQAVLRASESRLSQMLKVINEKEAQLLSAQIALNDAKAEIARLKKF